MAGLYFVSYDQSTVQGACPLSVFTHCLKGELYGYFKVQNKANFFSGGGSCRESFLLLSQCWTFPFPRLTQQNSLFSFLPQVYDHVCSMMWCYQLVHPTQIIISVLLHQLVHEELPDICEAFQELKMLQSEVFVLKTSSNLLSPLGIKLLNILATLRVWELLPLPPHIYSTPV